MTLVFAPRLKFLTNYFVTFKKVLCCHLVSFFFGRCVKAIKQQTETLAHFNLRLFTFVSEELEQFCNVGKREAKELWYTMLTVHCLIAL